MKKKFLIFIKHGLKYLHKIFLLAYECSLNDVLWKLYTKTFFRKYRIPLTTYIYELKMIYT